LSDSKEGHTRHAVIYKKNVEDNKRVIKIRKSKDRQHNGQSKKDKVKKTKEKRQMEKEETTIYKTCT
jgi:hypothetical protein